MNILVKIDSYREKFSSLENKIADYIIENPEKVSRMTSDTLAKELNVAQSTVSKFVKKIGEKGFIEFKVQISNILGKQENDEDYMHDKISLEDSVEIVYKKLIADTINSLKSTYENINKQELEKAIKALDNSKRIFCCGVGTSGIVANDFSIKMLKVGKIAIYNSDFHVAMGSMASINKDDAVIIFSHSGETEELKRIFNKIDGKTENTIIVTSNIESYLGQKAKIKLEVISNEGILRTAAMSSRITQLSIVDIIFLGVIKQNLEESITIIRNNYPLNFD